jgi:hypothetical protein
MGMADTVFDQASRRAARLDPAGFFAWLLSSFPAVLRFGRWLDTRSTPPPGRREPTADTVAELHALHEPGPPWLFPVEFQTEPDATMFGRLLVQLGEAWQHLRPDPEPGSRYQLGAAVVNLTGTRQSAPASRLYRLPGPDGLVCGGQFRERYLAEESADQTLGLIEGKQLSRVLLVFVPLMQGGGEDGIITRWLGAAGQETDARLRAEYASLALVLANLKDWYPAWKQALKEWDMREAEILKEWKREGSVETAQRFLRRLLQQRFGELPVSLLERIEATSELDRLERAFDQVQQLTKLDDLVL